MADDGRTSSERMTLADAVLELARTQIGVGESGGENRGLPVERYAGGRSEPWCAHFIAWLFRSVGAPLAGDVVPTLEQHNPVASVQALERGWPRPPSFRPERGDIVVFPWSHVGLVERFHQVGDRGLIYTIEGNATDPDDEKAEDGVRRRARLNTVRTRYLRPIAPPGWEPPAVPPPLAEPIVVA